jgi:hypothetical protein
MNDQEYRNILIYLYDKYIRRTIQDFRLPIETEPLNDQTIKIQKMHWRILYILLM